ncbi:MAG: hypothetical protein P2A85_09895 [Microcoleus anatoxicus]
MTYSKRAIALHWRWWRKRINISDRKIQKVFCPRYQLFGNRLA